MIAPKSPSECLVSPANSSPRVPGTQLQKFGSGVAGYNLRESIETAVRGLQSITRAKRLKVLTRIRADAPDALIGSREELRLVIGYLISNAIKFTERGRIVIQIDTEMQTASGVVLHCSVADSGVGMSQEKQNEILGIFTKSSGPMEGAHVGLAVCSRLVRWMGGRIWVDSEPGIGTAFHFTIHQGVNNLPNLHRGMVAGERNGLVQGSSGRTNQQGDDR